MAYLELRAKLVRRVLSVHLVSVDHLGTLELWDRMVHLAQLDQLVRWDPQDLAVILDHSDLLETPDQLVHRVQSDHLE